MSWSDVRIQHELNKVAHVSGVEIDRPMTVTIFIDPCIPETRKAVYEVERQIIDANPERDFDFRVEPTR